MRSRAGLTRYGHKHSGDDLVQPLTLREGGIIVDRTGDAAAAQNTVAADNGYIAAWRFEIDEGSGAILRARIEYDSDTPEALRAWVYDSAGANAEQLWRGSHGGGFQAYYAGSLRAEMTSAGMTVTGAAICTSGLGFATGAGGTVSQATSRAAGVTLNKACGQITLYSTTTTAGTFDSFTVTNSAVAATDTVIVNLASAATANSYGVCVTAVGAGSFRIQIHNIAAVGVAEAPVINFAVIKGVTS